MTNRKIKAWILDMDGVVVNNGACHRKAWETFCRKHGVLSGFDHHRLFGKTNRDYLEILFDRKLEQEEYLSLAGEKEEIYRELYAPQIQPMPGLLNFMQKTTGSGRLAALATSGPPGNVDFVLDALGIRRFFSAIVNDSMITRGKPDPEIFLLTANLLGIDPAGCAVVEDSVHGIEAAQKAGMKVVCLNHPEPEKVRKMVNLCVNDFNGFEPGVFDQKIRQSP